MSETAIEMIMRLHDENTERLYKRISELQTEQMKYKCLYHYMIGYTHRANGNGRTREEYRKHIEKNCLGDEEES
jgi:hypothetical protein